MKKYLLQLADWIYKKKCYFCSKSYENTIMCSKCYDEIEFLPYEASKILSGVNIYCACEYFNNVQKLIRGLKYHGKKELAYFQAKLMYEYWKNLNKKEKYIVIPVPLSKERLKTRKYNHMFLVAEEFCKMTGFELNTDLIKRIKNTKPQYNLNRKQRIENLKGAFKVGEHTNINSPLLILDDLCTTGTTFECIIEELKKHNIVNITCFATAKPKD